MNTVPPAPPSSQRLFAKKLPLVVEYQPGLTYPFPKQALAFTCLQYKSFENTTGTGAIALKEQFLHFPVFSHLGELSAIFITFNSLPHNLDFKDPKEEAF